MQRRGRLRAWLPEAKFHRLILKVFAQQALEYLVDMFNDEIEDVRIEVFPLTLQAMQSVSLIGADVALTEPQVQSLLAELKDWSSSARAAARSLLPAVPLPSVPSLFAVIKALLNSLDVHPEDAAGHFRLSAGIYETLGALGARHHTWAQLLVEQV